MGVCTYVTGIRFMSRTKLSPRVGYVAEQEERTFVTSDLHGLRVAKSQSGIRAPQLVGKNSHCSQWTGDPTAMPVSDRLVKSEPIRRLAVSYDVSYLHTRSSNLLIWRRGSKLLVLPSAYRDTRLHQHLKQVTCKDKQHGTLIFRPSGSA